jgi:hypothetical protein
MINQNRIYNWKINYRENGIGKITLFLSFVFSDYVLNLMNCKLKTCIKHS